MPGGRVWEHRAQAARCLSGEVAVRPTGRPAVCFFSRYLHTGLFTVRLGVHAARSTHKSPTTMRVSACECAHMHVFVVCSFFFLGRFGLGQLQLCQSELLRMPELPKEEEQGRGGDEVYVYVCVCIGGCLRKGIGETARLTSRSRWRKRKRTEKCYWFFFRTHPKTGCSRCSVSSRFSRGQRST